MAKEKEFIKRPIARKGYQKLAANLKAKGASPKGGIPPKPPKPLNSAQNTYQEFFSGESVGPEFMLEDINRGNHISRRDDKVRDIFIGLQDHDEAIMYYFNNVIKPSVIINSNRTNVPIIYGSPERWKSVQKDGFYRDKEGKIQTPLIMFKRDSVEKRRDLGNKLDGNDPQLYYTFQSPYTKRNVYDNFSVLQGRRPQKEIYRVVVPDFIRLNYTCTIWCDYVAQMNKLIEMINYTADSYWGDKERFHFNARIDTYNNTTELVQGDNRVVKTDFGLTIQGYLVPDSLNKYLSSEGMRKVYTRSKIIFNNELISTDLGVARTREEVRGELQVDFQTIDAGIGFQAIGINNAIT